jgi:hypothetical protein
MYCVFLFHDRDGRRLGFDPASPHPISLFSRIHELQHGASEGLPYSWRAHRGPWHEQRRSLLAEDLSKRHIVTSDSLASIPQSLRLCPVTNPKLEAAHLAASSVIVHIREMVD